MAIDVTLVPAEIQEHQQLANYAVLVIDVLRATSTIVTALAAGATSVVPVADAEEARHLAQALGGSGILAGEREGRPLPGFQLGNSPREYTPDKVQGRVVILTTTNGTYALRRVYNSAAVATGAFTNAAAAAIWGAGQLREGRQLLLACAGTMRRFAWEDASCAGYVVELIKEELGPEIQLSDSARAAVQVWQASGRSATATMAMSTHGDRLAKIGFAADLEYCAQLSIVDAIPQLWEGRLVLDRCAV